MKRMIIVSVFVSCSAFGMEDTRERCIEKSQEQTIRELKDEMKARELVLHRDIAAKDKACLNLAQQLEDLKAEIVAREKADGKFFVRSVVITAAVINVMWLYYINLG